MKIITPWQDAKVIGALVIIVSLIFWFQVWGNHSANGLCSGFPCNQKSWGRSTSEVWDEWKQGKSDPYWKIIWL